MSQLPKRNEVSYRTPFPMPKTTNTNLIRRPRTKAPSVFFIASEEAAQSTASTVQSKVKHEVQPQRPFLVAKTMETNLIRRPRKKAPAVFFTSSQDDMQSIASTVFTEEAESLHSIWNDTCASSVSVTELQGQRSFMDRCLWMRILYEQCGHIFSV